MATTSLTQLRQATSLGAPPEAPRAAVRCLAVEKQRHKVEEVLFWTFIAGLAWVPFWFGSNDFIAWGIND